MPILPLFHEGLSIQKDKVLAFVLLSKKSLIHGVVSDPSKNNFQMTVSQASVRVLKPALKTSGKKHSYLDKSSGTSEVKTLTYHMSLTTEFDPWVLWCRRTELTPWSYNQSLHRWYGTHTHLHSQAHIVHK